jgi:hypothetical protein
MVNLIYLFESHQQGGSRLADLGKKDVLRMSEENKVKFIRLTASVPTEGRTGRG